MELIRGPLRGMGLKNDSWKENPKITIIAIVPANELAQKVAIFKPFLLKSAWIPGLVRLANTTGGLPVGPPPMPNRFPNRRLNLLRP
jgi:hypothetical protein